MFQSANVIFRILFILSLIRGGYAQTLEDFEERFDSELMKIEEKADESEEGLRKQYMGALLRFDAEARRNGDLDGLEAARLEIKRVESPGTLEVDGETGHEHINRMRGIIRKKMRQIRVSRAKNVSRMVESVERYAHNHSTRLTRENRIEDAKAWRDWSEALRERPLVANALNRINQIEAKERRMEAARNDPSNFHEALQGSPVVLVKAPAKEFPGSPAAYLAGNEPKGSDKRLSGVRTPSAAGAGNSLVSSRVMLVEDEATLSSSRSSYYSTRRKEHVYVPRVEISPLPTKSLGRSLVVFDLYRRGSGSKREIIRTDQLLLPPVESGVKLVLDSGPYEYETHKTRSAYFGSSKSATAHEFYGYVVSIFDQDGALFYQRATESGLEDYARETPPSGGGDDPEGKPEGAAVGEDDQDRAWRRVD